MDPKHRLGMYVECDCPDDAEHHHALKIVGYYTWLAPMRDPANPFGHEEMEFAVRLGVSIEASRFSWDTH